ncbi:head-tail connector protein [Alloalcanivorax xenomutans]
MLDLTLIKQQIRMPVEFTDEDDLLRLYRDAARDFLVTDLNRPIYDSEADVPADDDGRALVINARLSAAELMLIGHFYENREAVVTGTISSEVHLGVERLVGPFRFYGV